MDKAAIKDILLRPTDCCQLVFCQLVLHDLLLDYEDCDFARYLVRKWKDIYNKSEFVVSKNEDSNKVVQLIDGQKDITMMINISKSGNLNLKIVSFFGYSCRYRCKSITKHINIVEGV